MAFSIRNIFQKGAESGAAGPGPGGGNGEFSLFGAAGPGVATAVPQGSPFGLMPEGAGATGFGGSIFKTRDQGEDMQGQPVAARMGASPFSPFGQSEGVALTVADILPLLPPEIARAGGAAPDQPVTISPQALEAALASGMLSVPVFEVYRVCPVLFQVPISPQDPRMVPLPQSKLAMLMANSRGGGGGQPAPAPSASPFAAMAPPGQQPGGFMQAAPGANPFAILPNGNLAADAYSSQPMGTMGGPPPQSDSPSGGLRPAGALPPRRPAGMPPALPTDFAARPSLQLPPAEDSRMGGSPFSFQQPPQQQENAGSPIGMQQQQPASPFGMPQASQPSMQAGGPGMTSLLSSAAEPVTDPELAAPSFPAMPPMGSPFGRPEVQASPFARSEAQPSPFASQAASPFSAPAGGPPPLPAEPAAFAASPFAAQFGAPASPFSMPAEPSFSPPQQPAEFFSSSPPPQQQSDPGASPFASSHMPPMPPMGESAPAFMPKVASFEPTPRPTTPEPPKLGALPFSSPPMAASSPSPSPFSMPSNPGAGARGSNEMMEISLAAVLKGQTPQDLGFDPNFIPAWINTKLPSDTVRQQLSTGQVVIDLGSIIDGTEHTFRTVIAHGKREYQVRIPTNEIFHLLPPVAGNPPPTPQPAAAPPAFIQPAPVQPAFNQPTFGQPTFGQPTFGQPTFGQPSAPQPEPPAAAAPSTGFIQPTGFQNPFSQPSARQEPPPAPPPQQPSPPQQQPVMPMTSFDPFAANAGDWNGKAGTPFFEPHNSGPGDPQGGLGSEQLFSSKAPPPPAPQAFPASRPPLAEPPKAPEMPVSNAFAFGPLPELEPFGSPEANPGNPFAAPAKPQPEPVRFNPPRSLPAFEPAPPSAPLIKTFAAEPPPMPRTPPVRPFADAVPVTPVEAAPSRPASARPPADAAPVNHAVSFGAVNSDPDQMLLRALLGAGERLDADRVVQLTSRLPGVLAAVAVKGGTSLAHGSSDRAAKDFQAQAEEISRSMRTLASLIGIESAETLSITSGERLITFAFTETTAFGVLHADREPASGLRDKLTLIGRELAPLMPGAKA